jgi:hypothetical protein
MLAVVRYVDFGLFGGWCPFERSLLHEIRNPGTRAPDRVIEGAIDRWWFVGAPDRQAWSPLGSRSGRLFALNEARSAFQGQWALQI